MTKGTALVCFMGALALSIAGCSESTDASKAANDAYHNHEAGPPPPPGAAGPRVSAVGPFAKSGGVPPGSGAPTTPPAGAAGPSGPPK